MTDVVRWLEARTPAMPRELRRALYSALERAALERDGPDTGSIADRLAAAGLAALRRSIDDEVAAESDRGRATDLLAADALLTYACEAATEDGPEALDRLTGSLDFRRFASLLEPTST